MRYAVLKVSDGEMFREDGDFVQRRKVASPAECGGAEDSR